ncbi:MAG TPA: outer membrane protein transport protein [Candidatus Sulfotelmatobacter sp.]|jgi:long-chain fatty acid transport protein|nr:outer membrane protein transport protein [Candidatus Sulfotelmatobacter sp.]
MMGKIRFATCASVLGLGVCLTGSETALASGFALREESAEGLGNSFAGQTAKAYNASTVYYNPAGMSNLDSDEVAGTVTWIAPVAKFSGSNSNPAGGNVSGIQTKDAVKDAAVGSVFGVYKIDPNWSVGMSVAAPYGMRVDYKADWVGRYQALHSDLTDIEFSPVVSYKVDDHWSIGGGPRVDYISANLSQAINSTAVAGAALPDGSSIVKGDDTGLGYVASVLYKFDDATRIGANYRSRVNHELSGTVGFNVPTALAGVSSFKNRDVTAKVTTPDSLNIGFYHDINSQWAVMSDASWTNWSLFKDLNIYDSSGSSVSSTKEKWHDTYFISLGANYKPDDKWVLHTGVAFDQSPVRDAYRTARIPDSNRYWTSFGVSYSVMPGADVHFAYAHLFADKASIQQTANSAAGTLTGSYDSSVDIVSASFAIKF